MTALGVASPAVCAALYPDVPVPLLQHRRRSRSGLGVCTHPLRCILRQKSGLSLATWRLLDQEQGQDQGSTGAGCRSPRGTALGSGKEITLSLLLLAWKLPRHSPGAACPEQLLLLCPQLT